MKNKDNVKIKGKIIIPVKHTNPPEPHEIAIAKILVVHFNVDVEFIIPVDDYMRKSADIRMFGVEWEIKSPTGNSKRTIANQFRFAYKQAKHIIIDASRTALSSVIIIKQIQLEMKNRRSIKRVILIEKNGNVLEINK